MAWLQALDLEFPLLSDWNADATREFGVGFEHRGLRDVSRRTAFLIDADGTIRAAWEYGLSDIPDLDEILVAVHSLGAPPEGPPPSA